MESELSFTYTYLHQQLPGDTPTFSFVYFYKQTYIRYSLQQLDLKGTHHYHHKTQQKGTLMEDENTKGLLYVET